MASRLLDMERKTLMVQFVNVEPLAFYATSDGTDLVQDILRSQLARPDKDILGQEGSLTIDDQAEFLKFEPIDLKNRILHMPVEHLAYCGALRRLRHDSNGQRDPDQIYRREFENIDLANRYPHLIVGPPIFVAVFHGFETAMCYTFITQSAEDACLLVMKMMRAFKLREQKLDHQGQNNQGLSPYPSYQGDQSSSPLGIKRGSPFPMQSQGFITHNRQGLGLQDPVASTIPTMTSFNQDPRHDDLIQRLLNNPNLEVVNQQSSFGSQQMNDIPAFMGQSSLNQMSTFPHNSHLSASGSFPYMGPSDSSIIRPPSPPILNFPDGHAVPSGAIGDNPQIVYKQNNQEVVYKQNIMVRWLQPPTPPPPAPIIIREVQAAPEPQPPIICRQVPPCPPTPPPIIVREKPPPCPPAGQPLIIEKRIPAPVLPRQVIVERYPAPPAKPATIIYEKYLPPQKQTRQVVVKREMCQPNSYQIAHQCQPMTSAPRIIREVIRQVPQNCVPTQTAMVCVPQNQQQQSFQQMVPVYATRQHIVQPQGVRVIRQVIGPAQMNVPSGQQVVPSNMPGFLQAVPQPIMQ